MFVTPNIHTSSAGAVTMTEDPKAYADVIRLPLDLAYSAAEQFTASAFRRVSGFIVDFVPTTSVAKSIVIVLFSVCSSIELQLKTNGDSIMAAMNK